MNHSPTAGKIKNCPPVYAIDGVTPVVDPSAFVHPSAVLIGDVIVGPGCYIGPGASLRGDFGRLIIVARANIQDNCVVHTCPERDTIIEESVTVGHCAIIHCCHIHRNAFIGMNALIMDNASIGELAMVAAYSFVKPGMVVPPRMLAAGVRAKLARELTEQEIATIIEGARWYESLTRRCLTSMIATEPQVAVEPDRKRISAL